MMYKLELILVAVLLSAALPAAPGPRASSRDVLPSQLPGSSLPVMHGHTYAMAGNLRMRLIGVGRDDERRGGNDRVELTIQS